MQDVMSRQTLGLRVAGTVFRIVAFQEGAMRLIRRACSAVLVSIAMIGTSGCGHGVHVHFNNGQTKVGLPRFRGHLRYAASAFSS